MKKMKTLRAIKENMAVLFLICIFALIMPNSVRAAESLVPTALDNLSIGLRAKSELVATDDGYMRVFYDGVKIGIEYYDDDFNIISKKTVEMENDIWGGFYAGSDAYYIVEGKNNLDEIDDAEVVRVIKYDADWNKVGAANITGNRDLFGGEVRIPFDNGCVEMAEYGDTLYIVTGHQGYADPYYNMGHQGFLMIAVNKDTMIGSVVQSDLGHSFEQYIDCKDSNLYVLEKSEGARCTMLSKYDASSLKGEYVSVFGYGGFRTSPWAIACYASVDDIATSSDNVLGLGTSIDQSDYDNVTSDTAHNIYLTVTPLSEFSEESTNIKWLTNYNGGGKSFLGTKITKVDDNRFMVSWEESNANKRGKLMIFYRFTHFTIYLLTETESVLVKNLCVEHLYLIANRL